VREKKSLDSETDCLGVGWVESRRMLHVERLCQWG